MRALLLALGALALMSPPAAALEGLELGAWHGPIAVTAYAGCGGEQGFDNQDEEFIEDETGSFLLALSAEAEGTCPVGAEDTNAIATTAVAESGGGTVDNGDSIALTARPEAEATWSQTNSQSCCAGSSRGDANPQINFTVTADAIPYSIAATTGSAIPTTNDAGSALGQVVLWRHEPGGSIKVAEAVHRTEFDNPPDTPAVDVDGLLGPGNYELTAQAECVQVSREVPTQQCSAGANVQLILGDGEGIPTVVIDQAPSGSGNPTFAEIAFHSNEPDATFRCSLDDGPEYTCSSPQSFEDLEPGQHRLTIVAIDVEDNESAPAVVEWEVGAFDCSTSIQIGFAKACGASIEETEPGSGIYTTEDKSWVGGFELLPRPGGKLRLDTEARTLAEEGQGVDVVFAGEVVPFAVSQIPVALAGAELSLAGAEPTLFRLPVAGAAKVTWADGGAAATFEASLKVEKLASVDAFSFEGGDARLTARLANGIGFEVTGAEMKIGALSLGPKALQQPRSVKFKQGSFKFSLQNGKRVWEGGLGIEFPLGKGTMEVAGTGSVFDGLFGSATLSVGGFNRAIPDTPLFLQSVAGGLALNPKWGFDLTVGATLGPKVEGRELIGFTGGVRGGAMAVGCPGGVDPVSLAVTGEVPLLEELGAGKATFAGTGCLFATSPAAAVKFAGGLELGPEGYPPLVAATGDWIGYVSKTAFSLEGNAAVTLPTLPPITGKQLLSSKGIAACTGAGVLAAGVAYRWGDPAPQAFTGCDLAPWQGAPQASTAKAHAAAANVRLPRNLRVAGFSARGEKLVLRGPKGVRIVADGTKRTKSLLVVPVEAEDRVYVFVRKPAAGRWRVEGSGVRTARGLPKPHVEVKVRKVKGKPARRRLVYRIRRIEGQQVEFHDTADDAGKRIGKPTRRRRGRFVFKPATATDRSHAIHAVITQNGLPRDRIVAGKFKAPAP